MSEPFVLGGDLPANPLGYGDPAGSLGALAACIGATSGQCSMAWLLNRASNIVVIPGATSIEHLEESTVADGFQLGAEQLAWL